MPPVFAMEDMEYEVAQPKQWVGQSDVHTTPSASQTNFAVIHDVVRPPASMYITSHSKPLLAEPVSSCPETPTRHILHTCMHTYIDTYIHTYLQIYIYVYV